MVDLTAGLTPNQLLEMYRKMCLIRSYEEEAATLSRKNMIHGVVHSYIGEEAVAVGMCAALDSK